MKHFDHIVISGSSISDENTWPNYVTWIQKIYGWSNMINVSRRGLGNKTIILNAVNHARTLEGNIFLILQLTSIDKWDWYVESDDKVIVLKKEKHSIVHIDKQDPHGFWCTGSHFPLWKEIYLQNFYSNKYQAYDTLMSMQWFQMLCEKNKWKFFILFESPDFSVQESQLNKGLLSITECFETKLIQNKLCETIQIDLSEIYLPGLTGFACINGLPWFSKTYKSHPGSLVHFEFTKKIILPKLDQTFARVLNVDVLDEQAKKFQNLWSDIEQS